MSWNPYPAYRASGIDAIGDAPVGWTPTKLRHVLALNPSTPQELRRSAEEATFLPMELIGEDGSLDLSRTRAVQEVLTGYSYFADGDVLFAKVTPCFENGKAAIIRGLPTGHGFGTTEVTALRPGPRLDQQFLGYLVRSDRFRQSGIAAMTGAGGLKRVPDEHVREYPIALPPQELQRAIVDFLDRETAITDALIAKQEQLIATLREDRIATITHAVTMGINPDVEVQDSRVEWLGQIPRHWVASRLKNVITSTESGTSVNAGNWPAGADEVGVLKTSCVSAGWFNSAANKTVVDQEEIDRATCTVRADSLIVNRANTPLLVGSAGYAATNHHNLFLSDKLWQVRFGGALARFIYYWTQTAVYRSQIAALCVGASSSMQNLAMTDFRNIAVAIPPADEQAAIVDFLADRSAKIDNLTKKSTDVIDVLRDYRSALITAAVAGKIDVRGCERGTAP